jgi:O-acetyl-ADP-ribose deacetylase (regulator of RNase III)
MTISYRKGDATRPTVDPDRNALIVHICNTRGGWGRGFVVAVSKRWPEPEAAYRQWFAQKYWDGMPFELGQIQAVKVASNLQVVNLLAQEGYGRNNQQLHQSAEPNSTPPIRYISLETCLSKVANLAKQQHATVHAPRLGSGLAGGSWTKIEEILNRTLAGIPVTIYDL